MWSARLSHVARFVATLAILVSFAGAGSAASDAARLDVSADQRVTLSGEHPSLETLLEDLSWRAGAELRSFGIEDRAVFTRIEDAPLDEALRRLLGRDHYSVGLAIDAAGRSRVAWIEVPGPREAAGARRGRSATRAPGEAPFQVPPKLFLTAFASEDPDERARALKTIERLVLESPEERARFLATDVSMFVEAMEKYPEAAAVLREVGSRQADDALRTKLDQVVAAIEASARGADASESR